MKKSLFALALAAVLAGCGGGNYQEPEQQINASGGDIVVEAAYHSVGQVPAPTTQQAQEIKVRSGINTRLDSALGGDIKQIQALDRPVRAVVHSPSSIRSLYNMPAIPADFSQLTAAERARYGAGQTIYVVGAYSGINIAADLKRFSAQFGLGGCTEVSLPISTRPNRGVMPPRLAAHDPAQGCQIMVLNAWRGGQLTSQVHPYRANWAAEYALDVQWAHATAPLARIVVLQGENNFANSLADGIIAAGRMGPGAVNMSWVAGEGDYSIRYEDFFKYPGNWGQSPGMVYLAAAGDRGAQANWPATSPHVISVGGTTTWTDSGIRKEVVWAGTGGGFSQWFGIQNYQTSLQIPDWGMVTTRSSPYRNQRARVGVDVAFNSDPYTGQFVVITGPDNVTRWYSFGGTSIATPQWAGIMSSVNAVRELAGRGRLTGIHQHLYNNTALKATFNDIVMGSNGSQTWAQSRAGYDVPTGWGTPDVTRFIDLASAL